MAGHFLRNCVETKCGEEEEEHIFWPFWHRSKMAMTRLFATFFDIYMHSVEDDILIQYLINFIFLSFFWDCQKSALIAIPMTPAGSISFNT